MGMATAYSLLKRGVKRVLVLERHTIGHDRAASTDNSKAIRFEYAEQLMYSLMVGRSLELWRELEAATGAQLYVNCGVVCWGRGERSFAERSYETLKPLGSPIAELSPDDLQRRFPQFSAADMTYATHNTEGGFLRASDCVAGFTQEVHRLGGEIREAAPVAGISQDGQTVRARLENGDVVAASRLILTVGAWGASFFPRLGLNLPLTAHKQQVVYMSGLSREFSPEQFPVFLNLDHEFYGFPLDSAGLFKTSIHLPGPLMNPDVPQPPDESFTEEIVSLLERYIPQGAKGKIAGARVCMYAMTPDEDFIIDEFPGYPNVVLGAGFSGHGFKFAPLMGELLASLSLGEPSEFPLGPFSLSRFQG